MNFKQIQFACAVAETGSFSRAAERCHATQPTLSNGIAQLETELGAKLFTRTTRKVHTTAFGDYLLPLMQSVLDARTELESAAEAYHNPEHKLLRIGLSPLVDLKLVDQVLAGYRRSHPQVNLFFKECRLDDLRARIDRGELDFGILPMHLDIGDCESRFFYEEPLYYLPQASAALPGQTHLSVAELPDVPVILTDGSCGLNGYLQTLLAGAGRTLDGYPGQALSYRVIEEWAELGIGAGILPRAKLSPDNAAARPLWLDDTAPACFGYRWVWNRQFDNRAQNGSFIHYLDTCVPALVDGDSTLPMRYASTER